MELGALICTASGPQCGKCPFGAVCRAKERGDQEYFPVKPAKRKKVELEEVVFAVISGGRTLLYLDREKKWHKGLWDFPAVLPMEEENLEKRGEAVFQYTVTHHKISRKIIILRVPEVIQDFEGSEYRWVELTSSPSVPVGSPARKGLEIIKKQFNGRGFLF
jgi:adenine-specific DNA glycosylase